MAAVTARSMNEMSKDLIACSQVSGNAKQNDIVEVLTVQLGRQVAKSRRKARRLKGKEVEKGQWQGSVGPR